LVAMNETELVDGPTLVHVVLLQYSSVLLVLE
jgi:hypothetical protein